MNECYFSWCPNHEAKHLPPDEAQPFCILDSCCASEKDLEEWRELRAEQLKKYLSARGII